MRILPPWRRGRFPAEIKREVHGHVRRKSHPHVRDGAIRNRNQSKGTFHIESDEKHWGGLVSPAQI